MMGKLIIAEISNINRSDCLMSCLIRYPFAMIKIPVRIDNAKNIFKPILPKAMLAYSVRNVNVGDPLAKYREKKYNPPNNVMPRPILYLLRVMLVFFLLLLLAIRKLIFN